MKKPKKPIILASDHGGFELKEQIKNHLMGQGYVVEDLGVKDDQPSDHPIFAKATAERVLQHETLGILVCGTGIGMSIAANRIRGIRAVVAHNETFAQLGRQHNNGNILCLAGRFLTPAEAISITTTFLETPFLGGKYKARADMMDEL